MDFIEQTKKWLVSFVIALNLCPFAKREFDQDRIRYSVIESTDQAFCLHSVFQEVLAMDEDSNIETTLIIFAKHLSLFDDYLDFFHLAEELIYTQEYEGVYQLASFHPDYQFENSDKNDPSNFTNRSPYPIIHIIREKSIEQALKTFPTPEQIPSRNIALLKKLGSDKIKSMIK